MKIVLMGYMGSGKSTVGKALADNLNYGFVDLDDHIVSKEGMSITQIFDTKGTIYYRKIEAQSLNDLLNKQEPAVIALGGGTPCYGINMKNIIENEDCISIYLSASVPFLAERLFGEKENRPLIANVQSMEEMNEFIGKHLFERSQYYMQADKTIDIQDKSVREIIEDILLKLF